MEINNTIQNTNNIHSKKKLNTNKDEVLNKKRNRANSNDNYNKNQNKNKGK